MILFLIQLHMIFAQEATDVFLEKIRTAATTAGQRYSSATEMQLQVMPRNDGQMFRDAQARSKFELSAAETLEKAFHKQGANWSQDERQQASERIAKHVHNALSLRRAASALRAGVHSAFNNLSDPNRYNPHRFDSMAKIHEWLKAGKHINTLNDYIPDS